MNASKVSVTVCSLCVALLVSATAKAQYAVPPDPAWAGDQEPLDPQAEEPAFAEAVARLGVGPALRVTGGEAFAGLGSSLDLGQSSGVRLQGVWTRVGGEGGEQHYGVDLWLSLGAFGRIRPCAGAGAALVREETPAGFHDYGVATVRATLDYVLGIANTDARLGVDALLSVPAIDAARSTPSALFVSRLGLGL